MPYSEIFKDHIANPRGIGDLPDADVVAEETNPVCGDRLRLSLRFRGEIIEKASFLAYGCAPTLACGSILTQMLDGLSKEKAAQITRHDIIDELGGLPGRKHHAAALAIETLRSALTLPIAR